MIPSNVHVNIMIFLLILCDFGSSLGTSFWPILPHVRCPEICLNKKKSVRFAGCPPPLTGNTQKSHLAKAKWQKLRTISDKLISWKTAEDLTRRLAKAPANFLLVRFPAGCPRIRCQYSLPSSIDLTCVIYISIGFTNRWNVQHPAGYPTGYSVGSWFGYSQSQSQSGSWPAWI